MRFGISSMLIHVWFFLMNFPTSVNGQHVDGFGSDIAVHGDVIAVTSIGSAFVFQRTNTTHWKKVQRFNNLDRFPIAVDESGTVYVGDAVNEKVHMYTNQTRNQWSHQLIQSNYDAHFFGQNMAACRDTLVVSAGALSHGAGNLFTFVKDTTSGAYSQAQQLVTSPPNSDEDARVGASLDIYGDKLVVAGISNLFLFMQDDDGRWKQSSHVAKSFSGFNAMPRSLAIYENTVVTGNLPPVYPFGQAAYVTVYNVEDGTFVKQQTIVGYLSNFFGLSVAIDQNLLVVGAPEEVYVYERTTASSRFVRKQTLTPNSSTGMDLFGQNVAVNGDTIVVGAYLKDGPGGGSAYVFSRKENGKWSQDQELKGEPLLPSSSSSSA